MLRSDWLWEALCAEAPDLAARFRQEGLRYRSRLAADSDPYSGQGRGWRQTLGAVDRRAAEARLVSLGYEWEWGARDTLECLSPRLPATRDLGDGRVVFFNQFLAAAQGWKDARNEPLRALRFGDGSPVTPEIVATVAALAEPLTEDFSWRFGDLVALDNALVMHGRRPFIGQRVVLASLAQ